jgi:putative transposase
MPPAQHHGADLLPLEGKVRGHGNWGRQELKQLEEENRKLKHVVAELTLDNRALKDVLARNF